MSHTYYLRLRNRPCSFYPSLCYIFIVLPETGLTMHPYKEDEYPELLHVVKYGV